MPSNIGSQIIILKSGNLDKEVIQLRCKGPEEAIYYQFSLANRIGDQTLLEVVATSNAEDVKVSNIVVDGQTFKCLISGGTIYHNVAIRFVAKTSNGETHIFNVILPIRPEGVLEDAGDNVIVVMGNSGPQGPQGPQGNPGTSYSNNGDIDINVRTLTTDEGKVKTDGSGTLTATHLKIEDSVYSDTTPYEVGEIYYQNLDYLSFKGWKVLDDNIFKGNPSDSPKTYEVFFRTEGFNELASRYGMGFALDAFISSDKDGKYSSPRKKRLAVFSTEGIYGHDTVNYMGDANINPSKPWYYGSRSMLINPCKLWEIRLNRNYSISGINSNHMSGMVGISTNYFTQSDDDTKQDGFNTMVMWDRDNESPRPVGAPYIPGDKKDSIPETLRIPIGTASFDIKTKKPVWWTGNAWSSANIADPSSPVISTDQTYTYLDGNFLILMSLQDRGKDPLWIRIRRDNFDLKKSTGAGLQYLNDSWTEWEVPKTGVLTLNYNFGFNTVNGQDIDEKSIQLNDEFWIAINKQGSSDNVPVNTIKHTLKPYSFVDMDSKTTLYKLSSLNGSLSMVVTKGDKIEFKIAWFAQQIGVFADSGGHLQTSFAHLTFFIS